MTEKRTWHGPLRKSWELQKFINHEHVNKRGTTKNSDPFKFRRRSIMYVVVHYKTNVNVFFLNHESDNKLSHLPTKNWPPDQKLIFMKLSKHSIFYGQEDIVSVKIYQLQILHQLHLKPEMVTMFCLILSLGVHESLKILNNICTCSVGLLIPSYQI